MLDFPAGPSWVFHSPVPHKSDQLTHIMHFSDILSIDAKRDIDVEISIYEHNKIITMESVSHNSCSTTEKPATH